MTSCSVLPVISLSHLLLIMLVSFNDTNVPELMAFLFSVDST